MADMENALWGSNKAASHFFDTLWDGETLLSLAHDAIILCADYF